MRVDLSCSYKHPGGLTVTESFWFINEQHVDLREDDQYKGRVQYYQTPCRMRITGLRVSDAQTYKFRFNTDDPDGKYFGSSGVRLSVTGLKIGVLNTKEGGKQLNCSSTCTLTNPTYIWYRNEQPVSEQNRAVLYLRDRTVDAGSYSCAVKEHEEIRSAAVCELGEKQWGVTYTPDSVCALEGSSVDLSCSYKHPGGLTVTESFWFINEQHVDLREDDQYKGRVQFYRNPCRMRITGLRASDAQTYKFRFITDDPDGKYTGRSGVSLSVTGLKIKVLNTQGGGKQLICSSTCALTNNPTYTWYRNGQSVSECSSASCSVAVFRGDSYSYSCAVKGSGLCSPPVYSPKETRAVVLPSGGRKEGDSVTLTCSSDADPPVLTFNWFKQSVNESLGTGQNYIITNISSQHSGLYYCTALNQLGQHSSAPARLDVFYPPRPPSLSEFNGFNGSITLVCVSDSNPASSYTWFRKTGSSSEPFRNGSNLTLAAGTAGVFYCLAENRYGSSNSSEWLFTSGVLQTPKPGDDTYPALNLTTTSSSEYDTLTHATHSPSDTYSTLNPATRTSSEYDTLTHATHSANDTYSTLNPATRTSSEYDTLMVVGPPPVQSGAPDEENN
ncbi:B-cell receptor CD22-like [Astyanax mexicanus]|uniref:B-cell receptor CD22-like n=1 Tax=Astyanax mexicanus TaxID=7994 RepID=UPI0020CB555E|nr:B-cell receptor CD22-like [Astyanax mexicanus]